jgi:arsenical-resistance protein 2
MPFASAGISQIIWYCSAPPTFQGAVAVCLFAGASSRGRGNRAAGRFADYLGDQGNMSMKSLVLRDGIKGWAAAGSEYGE